MRTLKPLLFKPGRLTRDFMSGLRFRYTPPMRLYIFSSLVFFLLAALFSSNTINLTKSVDGDGETDVMLSVTPTLEEEQRIDKAMKELQEGLQEKGITEPVVAEPEPDSNQSDKSVDIVSDGREEPADRFNPADISLNGEPWDRETNPVDFPLLPDWLNERLNDEVENSPKKAKEIEENPNLMLDKVFDLLPATMFVLLPIVALIFKFWYLFAKRYYVEHLIFSLHNHAFIFVCLTILLVVNEAGILMASRGFNGLTTSIEWLETAIWSWIPLYLLISLRVVYQQSWLKTVLKFFLIGISYLTLLGFVSVGVAIASFILL